AGDSVTRPLGVSNGDALEIPRDSVGWPAAAGNEARGPCYVPRARSRRGPGWTRPRPQRPKTNVSNDETRDVSYGRPVPAPSAATAAAARKPVTVPSIRAAKGRTPLV